MTKCWCCNGADHDHTTCPLFGKSEEYLAHVLQPTQQEPQSSSLAPTLLEELYGGDAIAALQQAADDDELSPEQRELALEISGGMRPINGKDPEIQAQLDEIAHHLATSGRAKAPTVLPPVRKPGYVSTRAEMEDFGDTAGSSLQPASDSPYTSINRANEPANEPE